jgi:hypothetical protein
VELPENDTGGNFWQMESLPVYLTFSYELNLCGETDAKKESNMT